MSFEAFPGLRLGATTSRRSWTYRFKSPVDRRMRQQKLGEWPAMSQAAAIAQWQQIRARRDAGVTRSHAQGIKAAGVGFDAGIIHGAKTV
jgi:hypothetical protein